MLNMQGAPVKVPALDISKVFISQQQFFGLVWNRLKKYIFGQALLLIGSADFIGAPTCTQKFTEKLKTHLFLP